ncbi:uncharacterized protein LOC144104408 isoform X3 [Amblyomma americanum]
MRQLRLWVFITVLTSCRCWTQSPTLHYCLEDKNVYVSNVIITNATLGQHFGINYTLEFMRRLQKNPRLDLIMSIAGGPQIPCVDNIGSCSYNLCNAETEIETRITDPWRNECPIPRGLLNGYFRHQLSHTAWTVLKVWTRQSITESI